MKVSVVEEFEGFVLNGLFIISGLKPPAPSKGCCESSGNVMARLRGNVRPRVDFFTSFLGVAVDHVDVDDVEELLREAGVVDGLLLVTFCLTSRGL